MNNKTKLAGVVVLYNPDQRVIENIKSYINDLPFLIAVDNSDNPDQSIVSLIKKIKNIHYISNSGNKGIASALNTGANFALENDCDTLFTMDQDSTPEPSMIQQMLTYIDQKHDYEIGIISPCHIDNRQLFYDESSIITEIETAMTSGNILNLKAYKLAGPFLEKLFIDYVDIEYCLRLRRNEFKIMRLNKAKLKHQLGNTTKYNLLFFNGYTRNNVPVRNYYITRNRLYIIKTYFKIYPKICWSIFKGELKDIIKILILEKEKKEKIIMILKGIKDFFCNKYGEYKNNI